MRRIVTKAMAIQFIDDKCHIKKQKSCKTALSGYYTCASRDLLLMPSGVDTHTYANIPMFADKTISKNQAHVRSVHAWFKNEACI